MNVGDFVFFKHAKYGSSKRSAKQEFKGHGFGIFLGHVQPHHRDPNITECLACMGTVGFVLFQDIAEFLTPEDAKKCVDKFNEKYFKKPETDETEQVKEIEKPSLILGLDGEPLGK